MGHVDAFPPPRLSVRCRFSQRTFAETRSNGRDAPMNEPARAGGERCLRSVHFFGVMRGSA